MRRKKEMIFKLLELKNFIKRIGDRYWLYVKIAIKFISAIVIFSLMNIHMGYSDVMDNTVITIGLSVIAAFSPDAVFSLLAMAVSLAHLYSVSIVLAVVMLVVYLIIYFAYVRFVPGQIFVILAIPFLYILGIPYVMPLICGVFFAPYSIVSNVLGILLYYVYIAVEGAAGLSGDKSISNTINFFNVIVDNIRDNKYMLFSMIIFAFIALLTYIIRIQKFNHSSDVSILTGIVLMLVAFVLASSLIEKSDNFVNVIVGVCVSGFIAFMVRFFRISLDYSGVKNIQFEDDEYYYYVKAVPKLSVSAPDKQVMTIHAQIPTSNTMNLRETIEKTFEESEHNVTAAVEEDR
ncbi:MAG: hypothetical protein HFH14_09925 [Lachnospiraceae bacterium]|nr:hypothetical protein [Lachnospiraceae bacterium]